MKKKNSYWKKETWIMTCYILCLAVMCGPALYDGQKDVSGIEEETDAVSGNGEDAENLAEAIACVAESVNQEAPRIALTFDDGPSGTYTPILLDGLKERGVKATFFLIGENAEQYPEIVKRISEEGHLIGTHTYHHVNLGQVSDEEAYQEIQDTNDLIYQITGKEVEYMRPPFGVWQRSLESRLTVLPILWSVDPLDWTTSNTEEIVNKVVTETEENDIILLHDCYESSVQAALRVIDILQGEGYEFVTADEMLMR